MSQQKPTDVEATRYAENYIIYGDQTRAWRAAFPSTKAKPESVHAKASAFHGIVKVQLRIKELRAMSKKQSEEEFNLTVGQIKQMLTAAATKGLKNKIDQQGNQVPVSIPGAVSALAEINKMDGNHASARLDVSSSDGTMTPKPAIDASKLSTEALKEIMAASDATEQE